MYPSSIEELGMAPLSYTGSFDVGKATIVGGWILASFAIFMLCMAFMSIHLTRRDVGAEDCLIVLATVLAILLQAISTWAVIDEGQGRHIQDETWTETWLVAKLGFQMRRSSQC